MKPVRVLHTEWSGGWGGQEIRIMSEMQAVRARGIEVFLACAAHVPINKKAYEAGFTVFNLPFKGTADLKTLFGLMKIIRHHDIDIVNTHSGKDTWVGGLAAKLTRRGFIRTRHLSYPISTSRLNFINELADHVITSGSTVRQAMIDHNRIKPDRINSIPSGPNAEHFDIKHYKRDKIRQRYGLKATDVVIGIVAFLRGMKRHDIFLDMAQQLRDKHHNVKFLIVGNGGLQAEIEQWIKIRNLQDVVIMTGYVEDPAEIMAAMDIGVITSDSGETTTQVIIQYMLMGLQVVTTQVGSVTDFLYKDNYLVVPVNDVKALAHAVEQQMQHPRLNQNNMTANRRYLIDNFSLQTVTDKMLAVYDKVLERTGRTKL